MAVFSIARSVLNKATVEETLRVATNFVNTGDSETIAKWARIRRMWSGLIHDNTTRKDCETQLAWALGYNCIEENK